MPQLAAQRRLAALARHTAGGHANAVAAESTAEARRRAQELVRKEQEAAAQKLQDEQQANLQGGFGVLEPDTSGYFTLDQQDEALEFFRQEGVSLRQAPRGARSVRTHAPGSTIHLTRH
jgi:hypothetical protein